MKKLLAVSLAVILVFSLGFTTFANGFVQSPSNNSAPVVDKAETKNETAGCTAEIEITPYSERDELPAELKKQMEDIYKKISEATDVSALSTELKSFCDKNKINTKDLAVSDLFDIAYEGCTAHDGHGQFTITLKAETLKIVVLGLIAFCFSTAGGLILGKIMCKLTGGKINPLIGSAGVSAVPMAARVSQTVGAKENPTNFLLMHAMGPNVAGVIGSAVAAGFFMLMFK